PHRRGPGGVRFGGTAPRRLLPVLHRRAAVLAARDDRPVGCRDLLPSPVVQRRRAGPRGQERPRPPAVSQPGALLGCGPAHPRRTGVRLARAALQRRPAIGGPARPAQRLVRLLGTAAVPFPEWSRTQT